MKKLYIVANWKANKAPDEARLWIAEFARQTFETKDLADKEIIICPSFPVIALVRDYVMANNLSLKIGAQDVSSFSVGAYTGEVPAEIIKALVDFCIVGHSERRENFSENFSTLAKKVDNLKKLEISPIFCVQGKDTDVPEGVEIIAYEPIEAIGTGNPDTPENANNVAGYIKEKYKTVKVLYGGSVTAENVAGFTSQENIDGVLVGGASLTAESFLSLIDRC